MDRIQEASSIIIKLNQLRRQDIDESSFIKAVCDYFDLIKEVDLTASDLKFLKYLANMAGIPHYYKLLEEKFYNGEGFNTYDLNTFASIMYESSLHTDEHSMLHKYQKQILNFFTPKQLNRFFLSASTSFGKTHIVFEIIKKMKYKNVVLIFPTIALLSENLSKLVEDDHYSYFNENYKIHTLSEVKSFGENNLFIYTPERFLSYCEKNENTVTFDFSFIDEVYKIDNEYLMDEETKENERDVAYRLAVYYCLKGSADALLAGPYIEFSKEGESSYNPSFDLFLAAKSIKLLDFNKYEIVNKTYCNIKTARENKVDEKLSLSYTANNKAGRLVETLSQLSQNAIVYCANRGKRGGAEGYALKVIEANIFSNHDCSKYADLIQHIETNFSEEWVLLKGLKNGVGIHHGLIPKYIQKEIISLFNDGLIRVLISTTTITEGVNTSAKNLIVMHHKKGNKNLKKFDAKNIAGRAGRFGYHFSGRVIVIQNDFMETIEADSDGIKHKNYDLNSPKDEIDLFYSEENFLSDSDKSKKQEILSQQLSRNLPDDLFNMYKVVSRLDKLRVYDSITKLSEEDMEKVKALIVRINYRMDVDYEGFQVVLDVIKPIIKNESLLFLIEHKAEGTVYSTLTSLIYFYLRDGFKGSVKYHRETKGEDIDKAITETSKFVYNTLKYQVVKYLGVFNIMYKYIVSVKLHKELEDVKGIDKLLLKFEYNAVTDEGRIASDYGVPSNILNYYEKPEEQVSIKSGFDQYENRIFDTINAIVNR